jgi:undecaprenyl phosphate-alpha-L-ara4FN deformylase
VRLALKVDVDTDRGTRVGVPTSRRTARNSARRPASSSRSAPTRRAGGHAGLRPGFFGKVSRTSVVQIYGIRTLLNGTLLPAPHIGRRNAGAMRAVRDAGFEVGIHCYNHYRWQDTCRDGPCRGPAEFGAARAEFSRIFGARRARPAPRAGRATPEPRGLRRGGAALLERHARDGSPVFPRIGGRVFRTLEIPSTLPTLDELMGRPEFPDAAIAGTCCRSWARPAQRLHAPRRDRGHGPRAIFRDFLPRVRRLTTRRPRAGSAIRSGVRVRVAPRTTRHWVPGLLGTARDRPGPCAPPPLLRPGDGPRIGRPERRGLVALRRRGALKDPARIRAFFVHPSWVRRGIGSAIMAACERAIRTRAFATPSSSRRSPACRSTPRSAIGRPNATRSPCRAARRSPWSGWRSQP